MLTRPLGIPQGLLKAVEDHPRGFAHPEAQPTTASIECAQECASAQVLLSAQVQSRKNLPTAKTHFCLVSISARPSIRESLWRGEFQHGRDKWTTNAGLQSAITLGAKLDDLDGVVCGARLLSYTPRSRLDRLVILDARPRLVPMEEDDVAIEDMKSGLQGPDEGGRTDRTTDDGRRRTEDGRDTIPVDGRVR